jgi:aryl-alcohol dehydrogenase-like predicted oxidoreductase
MSERRAQPAMRQLGRTGIEITPIGLGTWQFSEGQSIHGLVWSKLEPNETDEIVRAALDKGVFVSRSS